MTHEPMRTPPPISTPPPRMRLADVVRELGDATLVAAGNQDVVVTGVHHDSRLVEPGDLFVARVGKSQSGLSHLAEAERRGAVAVLVQRGASLSTRLPVVEVGDVQLALALSAAAVYGHPTFGLEVVGITGTNGKTTSSHLVRAIVLESGGRCGVIGTLGSEFEGEHQSSAFTSPEADELARSARRMRDRGASHLVMEVSSIALTQRRADAVRFRVAAFTNLTQDHLDFHGSMAAYRQAKARLFQELSPAGMVINVRDAFGRELSERLRGARGLLRVTTAGDLGPAEIVPLEVGASARGIELRARTPQGEVSVSSSLIGGHNVENLLTAIGIGTSLEIPCEVIGRALSQRLSVPGRLERCDDPALDQVVALVDYAHTPDALERALVSVRSFAAGRLICVFGCGGDRDRQKRPLMGEVAGRLADRVIVTNDNPRSEDPEQIAHEIRAGLLPTGTVHELCLDRREAILRAIRSAAAGDVVLIAGKGHEPYQIIGQVTLPFDDRDEARAALAARRAG